MDTIELKHIAPYIPHQLKVEFEGIITDLEGVDLYSKKPLIIERCGENITDITPLLRPLTDLSKEITHKGENFIPMEVIGNSLIPEGSFEEGIFGWGVPTGGDDYQDYYLTIEKEEVNLMLYTWCGEPHNDGFIVEALTLSYTIFNQLIEWHFDVFGLIDSGHAKKKKIINCYN